MTDWNVEDNPLVFNKHHLPFFLGEQKEYSGVKYWSNRVQMEINSSQYNHLREMFVVAEEVLSEE